jgi:hypothetical protein
MVIVKGLGGLIQQFLLEGNDSIREGTEEVMIQNVRERKSERLIGGTYVGFRAMVGSLPHPGSQRLSTVDYKEMSGESVGLRDPSKDKQRRRKGRWPHLPAGLRKDGK